MRIDVLVAEIGSTTTVVDAFSLGKREGLKPFRGDRHLGGTADYTPDGPSYLGQGIYPTTVDQGDVTIGLKEALRDLKKNLGIPDLAWSMFMAASSAAGGLSMTCHGLVYDMTVRAAKEAALGAGAVIKMVTAGEITRDDAEEIMRIRPKLILLAGGVDFGEKNTAIRNARVISDLSLDVPVVYAGNIAARKEIGRIFSEKGVKVYFVDNVYPNIDQLIVEPARKVIQEVFEEHIVKAPGMETIREMVKGPIMPTPGAVMESCKMLYPSLGDLCAIDVGGATTDVHSCAKGSPEIQAILESPEPLAKRTVEGDLGIHINARNVYQLVKDRIQKDLGFDPMPYLETLQVIPQDEGHRKLVAYLSRVAAETAFSRHAGKIKYLYGPEGRTTVASGKDLSAVKTIIGTGGPLTRLPGGFETLGSLLSKGFPGRELWPKSAKILLDSQYIMASCGVLSRKFPEEAKTILLTSLGLQGSLDKTVVE